MKRLTQSRLLVGLVAFVVGSQLAAAGDVQVAAPQSDTAAGPPPLRRSLVSILGDATLAHGQEMDVVFVIGGQARIDGVVTGQVSVLGGDAIFGPESAVGGRVFVLGGAIEAAPGARLEGDAAVIGGEIRTAGNRPVAAGSQLALRLPPALGWVGPWIGDGVLWGRPLPPQHTWAWAFAAVLFAAHALALRAAPHPTAAVTEVLLARPFTSYFVGLILLLLALPTALLLLVSGIGVVLLPFLFSLLAGAALFGGVAVYRQTGVALAGIAGIRSSGGLGALAFGAAAFHVVYALPVAGLVAWGLVTPFALGSAGLAAGRRLRRELGTRDDDSAAEALADALLAPRAGFGRRVLAIGIDVLAVGFVLALAGAQQAFLPAWMVYHVVAWTWRRTTLGGALLGIRLARTDGRRIDLPLAFARMLAAVLSVIPLGLGFLWALWGRERITWHDHITGTRLVLSPSRPVRLQDRASAGRTPVTQPRTQVP